MSGAASEFDYIDWIRRRVGAHPSVPVGIGDDTAVVRAGDGRGILVTVDMLMEGVHFTFPRATPRDVGRKALAVNLSDIAAMAGRPVAAVVSVALNRSAGERCAHELHEGIQTLADEFDVAVAGGDTNAWNGPLVVSVTVIGEVVGTGPVLRGGARPGDAVFVTGTLGGSLAGKHLDFQPRVREALALHQAVTLHAMIDISDGLGADLHHILDESHVGAAVDARSVPISDAALHAGDGKSPLEHALADGEDFELLFTVSEADAQRLIEKPPIGTPLTRIGTIVSERQCLLVHPDGKRVDLPRSGWQHMF